MKRGNKNHHNNHRAIAFIDAEVIENLKSTVDVLDLETELVIVDYARDGIEQITEVLAKRNNIKSLQILASVNGNKDSLRIGATELNIHTLEAYGSDLQQWKNALSNASEILLYGCLVSIESMFLNFINRLSEITGADISAFVTFSESITVSQQHSDRPIATNYDSDRYSLLVAWRS